MLSFRWRSTPRRLRLWGTLLLLWAAFACQTSERPSLAPAPVASRSQAIIGGKPDLRHPEVGALTTNGRTFCTGTLIAKKVVLTAAHCVDAAVNYAKSANVQFRIDMPDSSASNGFKAQHFDFDTALFQNHPKWNGNLQNGGDIGVGILKAEVTIVKPMPASLRPMGAEWRGRKLLFLGYGLIQSVPSSVSPNRKYAVDLPITALDPDRFTHYDKGKSVCHGDSGGPAIFLVDGRQRVLGVNSYVSAQRVPGTTRSTCSGSGTSTRTDTFSAFIRSVLAKHGDGPETCKTAAECGQCGACNAKGQCEAAKITGTPKACKPCSKDDDCQGGICFRFATGYRCLQPCNSSGCCPDGSYCAKERTHQGFQELCLPFAGQCPAHPCSKDGDCGAGEFCEGQVCKPKPLARSPQLCKPCLQHSECGEGGYCFGLTGYKRCTQPCDKGDFCPADTRCQEIVPGLPRQCVPTEGSCQEPCQFSSHCSPGYTCQEGKCVSQVQGGYGAPCDPGLCQAALTCATTLSGKRCLQQCGAPAGSPGSNCRNGSQCDGPASCFALSSDQRLCFHGCQSNDDCSKTGGGFCNQGVCLCTGAGDCSQGHECNLNPGFAGACTPKSTLPSCPTGQECTPLSGESFCIAPKPGERTVGQPCDALNRCRNTMVCVETQDAGGVCFEKCSQDKDCTMGGQCARVSDATLCLCRNDSQCRNGRTCHIAISNRFGYCETQSLTNPCIADKECPQGFYCDAGACKSGPRPETTAEPTPEPTPEPKAEPAKEPTPEPTPEPASEPTPEPTPEPTSDAGPQDTTPEAPKKGCGCDASRRQQSPVALWWMLLLLWLPIAGRRRPMHQSGAPQRNADTPDTTPREEGQSPCP